MLMRSADLMRGKNWGNALGDDPIAPPAELLQRRLDQLTGDALSFEGRRHLGVGQAVASRRRLVVDQGPGAVAQVEFIAARGPVVDQWIAFFHLFSVLDAPERIKFGSEIVFLSSVWIEFLPYCSTGTPAKGAICRGAARTIPTASGSRR